tara:strand:- start:1686 stop:1916 length:231 start_codon:yes stop_codon:yes gene_type:complete
MCKLLAKLMSAILALSIISCVCVIVGGLGWGVYLTAIGNASEVLNVFMFIGMYFLLTVAISIVSTLLIVILMLSHK